jgi:hypothetical protein
MPTCLGECFSSPSIIPFVNLVKNALESSSFSDAKENGKAKMNISRGFGVVREGEKNGS